MVCIRQTFPDHSSILRASLEPSDCDGVPVTWRVVIASPLRPMIAVTLRQGQLTETTLWTQSVEHDGHT